MTNFKRENLPREDSPLVMAFLIFFVLAGAIAFASWSGGQLFEQERTSHARH